MSPVSASLAAGAEPLLAEMLADSIVIALMRCDGVTKTEVEALIAATPPQAGRSPDTGEARSHTDRETEWHGG